MAIAPSLGAVSVPAGEQQYLKQEKGLLWGHRSLLALFESKVGIIDEVLFVKANRGTSSFLPFFPAAQYSLPHAESQRK